jgi:hypothetical protein
MRIGLTPVRDPVGVRGETEPEPGFYEGGPEFLCKVGVQELLAPEGGF